MDLKPSVLEQLHQAHQLATQALGRAPQLYDCHLDHALLLLVLAMKRARRSPHLRWRRPYRPDSQGPYLPVPDASF